MLNRKEFCNQANRLFKCRKSSMGLDKCSTCMFRIAGEVEYITDTEGVCIREALERWAVRKIPNSASFLEFADALGVNALELQELIAVMRRVYGKPHS